MQRREFLAAGTALAILPRLSFAQHAPFDPRPGDWRNFEITTHVEVLKPAGVTRVWVPVPSVEGDYQKLGGNSWHSNGSAQLARDGKYGAAMVVAEWTPSERAPVLEVVSSFSTRNRKVDFSRPNPALRADASTVAFNTEATEHVPTDGVVRDTAREIVKGKKGDVEKARAIYEWVVDNTFRDPKTKGCGIGDVKALLESGNLGGKCADLNALYVGLARASGLPARDVYGLRVVKSDFGYRSLGAGSTNVTRAQHCRAEVFLTGFGWVPVDPADVRKVVLEEKPQPTTLADPLVPPVRQKLFGAWEMNWLAYNEAQDVALPGSSGPKVNFFMYPQAETGGERLDSLDPDNFKYTITARELKV
ncbi:MAG TPA: transglutaminase domain-containing protein [Burkholderiales bacterium]|jgi:transglutaminase-like putative cysteine protease|nr:transglutaminase domain-containing protein [Burkholderiales bacterium]